MSLFSKKGRAEFKAANAAGREAFQESRKNDHARSAAFFEREVEKYETKAAELDAAGKTGAAARARKVAERSRRLAAKQAEKAD